MHIFLLAMCMCLLRLWLRRRAIPTLPRLRGFPLQIKKQRKHQSPHIWSGILKNYLVCVKEHRNYEFGITVSGVSELRIKDSSPSCTSESRWKTRGTLAIVNGESSACNTSETKTELSAFHMANSKSSVLRGLIVAYLKYFTNLIPINFIHSIKNLKKKG